MNTPAVEGLAEKVAAGRNKILSELRKVIVGQDEVVDEVLMALFCGGHCLITRVPGLAKTLLVKTLSQIPLADEINRTPPKTQAALLEAMQEYHVTAAGRTYQLEKPFFVLATQNPIELEGTYPLPEAQLDRFMFNVVMTYLHEDDEVRVVTETTGAEEPAVSRVLSGPDILEFQHVVR